MDSVILFLIIAAISLVLAVLMGAFFVIAWIYMRVRLYKLKRLANLENAKLLVPTLLSAVPVDKVISQVKPKVKLLQSRLHMNLTRAQT